MSDGLEPINSIMSSHTQTTDGYGGYHTISPQEHHGIIISTANDIPGYRIVKIHGVVYGITVRSRNLISNIGVGLKSLVGGELKSWTKMVISSRDQSVDRLVSGVREIGGNAIYAFRFDNGNLGEGITEVCCYGTAVTIEKIGLKDEPIESSSVPNKN